jgi:hypothetical protein
VASANDTEIEPANAAPSGVIVGVLTVLLFELVALVVAVVVDRLVAVDSVFVVLVVVVVELDDMVVTVDG